MKSLHGILHICPWASPTSFCTQWLWLRFVEMDFHELAILWQSCASKLLGGGLHSLSAFLVIFCFKLQRNKVALVVSQHRHGGGQHGKQELVFRLMAIVLQSGREWAAEVSGVLGCRRLDQRQSRCVSSPPPLLGPGWACVFTHDLSAPLFFTAHNSKQQYFPKQPVSVHLRSQGQKNTAELRPCLNHLIWRKCVHTAKACLNP